jgi:hypothetical protein
MLSRISQYRARQAAAMSVLPWPCLDPGASTVGMPVTRPPPYSPGRAVCPPPVPRWSARPRGNAEPSRLPSPVLDLRDAWPCHASSVQPLRELLPGKTLPLPTAPIAPLQRTAHRALEQAGQGAVGAVPTIVVVVAPHPAGHLPVARASRQMPGRRAPCRPPSARRLELLARGGAMPVARLQRACSRLDWRRRHTRAY